MNNAENIKFVSKVVSDTNFEDVPASVQASHKILARTSAYQFFNGQPFHGSFSMDPTMHGLAPVTSVLDMKDPSNPSQNAPFTTSPVSAGLMNTHKVGSTIIQEQFKRFGFPHLSYPSNPYLLTPYDGVYAVGDNNFDVNNNAKPDNQCHVEDVQAPVADYLSQTEVAQEELYLSNQTIGGSASDFSGYTSGYIAEFEARTIIKAGRTHDGTNSIYDLMALPLYLTPAGDLKVAVNTKAILHAGEEVALYPGTEIPQGAEADLYIDFFPSGSCTTNVLQRTAPTRGYETVPLTQQPPPEQDVVIENKGIEVFPNPAANELNVLHYNEAPTSVLEIYDLSGKKLLQKEIQNNARQTIDFNLLENGIYLMRIADKNFKLIVNK